MGGFNYLGGMIILTMGTEVYGWVGGLMGKFMNRSKNYLGGRRKNRENTEEEEGEEMFRFSLSVPSYMTARTELV